MIVNDDICLCKGLCKWIVIHSVTNVDLNQDDFIPCCAFVFDAHGMCVLQ